MSSRKMLSRRQCVFVIVVLPIMIIPAFMILKMSHTKLDDEMFIPPKKVPLAPEPSVQKRINKSDLNGPIAVVKHIKPKPSKCFDFIWSGKCHDTCYHFNTLAKRKQRKQVTLQCGKSKPRMKTIYTPKKKYVYKATFQDSCLQKVINKNCNDGHVVPNIVHYAWLGKVEFTFIHFLSFLSVHRFQNPCLIMLHGDKMPQGRLWAYFLQISSKVIHVRRKQPKKIFKKKLTFIEHKADVLKLEALKEYGGIYVDTDQVLLKSLDTFRNTDVTIGSEYDSSAANSLIMAKKNAAFIKLWYDSYRSYSRTDKDTHSNKIPYRFAKKYKDLVHIVGDLFTSYTAHQLSMIYSKNNDWSKKYGMHLHLKLHQRFYTDPFTMDTIKSMNNTAGAVARHIVYGNTDVCRFEAHGR